MPELAELHRDVDTIEATLNYFVAAGGTPVTLVGEAGESDRRLGGGANDPRRVTLYNGRHHASSFALERNGFRFLTHRTRVRDFFDEEEVRGVYYPEMEALVRAESGARRVVVFDHTLRTADEPLRRARMIRDTVRRVHNDYTEWSGPQRVRDLLPLEAEELLSRRFAIIQVWRPIRHPVESSPLAIADAQSLSPDSLVVTERHYRDRVGQTYAITYDPAHRWYWFPHMRPDEALLFKTYEADRSARARWTAHTAFEDEGSPSGARPRESIEIRSLALF